MVLGLCKDTIQARDHFVCTDESPTGLINGTRGNIEIKSDGNEEACFKY